MRKTIIGLLISLATAYLLLERQKAATEQMKTLSSVTAPGMAGTLPQSVALDQAGGAMGLAEGQAVDLNALPPEARAIVEQQMKLANAASGPPPDTFNIPASRSGPKQYNYRERNDGQSSSFASGWTVLLERKLSDRFTRLSDQLMTELETQLDRAVAGLPRTAADPLRKVVIVVGYDGSAAGGAIRYRWPDPKAPDAARDGTLEIPNAQAFVDAAQTQPWMVMHELAQAWHHRMLGGDHPALHQAYADALKLGAYSNVKQASGKMGRSGALSSEREFFAQLSRAYYGRNDTYPFVREELMQYDVAGSRMIEAAWVGR